MMSVSSHVTLDLHIFSIYHSNVVVELGNSARILKLTALLSFAIYTISRL